MIVSLLVDEEGAVQVTVDSDGDQGDHYSPDVLDDLLARACQSVVTVWIATRLGEGFDVEDADEDADSE